MINVLNIDKKSGMKDRYESGEQESSIKQFWQKNNIYAFDKGSEKQVFSVDTPPPTVSGALHIGHIFSYLHTDIIARYKRMTGFNVYYPMGFDDNGLPTEKFVEKKLKIRSKDLKRSEFIDACLKECAVAEEDFKALWQAIGLSVDWNYCYSTISPKTQAVSQKSFLKLLEKGLVYRKKEPSLFCTAFQTTVAQAELDSIEQKSSFNTIKFVVEDGADLLIATTRPELLAAVVAIFVHPEDERYKKLVGKKVTVPLFGHSVKVIADDAVLLDKGTGVVMCSTFGDQQDVVWFKKHGLDLIEAIGRDGKMTDKAGFLQGLKVAPARDEVLKRLDESGLLIEQKDIVHNVSIYERSKKEIEYVVSSQWFIKILDFKDDFIKIGREVEWYPEFMRSRYEDWVSNLNWDWCISRQRYFGISFPVWHCQDCGEVLAAKIEDLPIDPSEMNYPGGKCKCGSSNIVGDTDVMDTWATSASTPEINADMLGKDIKDINEFLPMSIRPQAHDIIRTWAFYTIVKQFHLTGKMPWRQILVSGHVLAGGKEKISKSAGNSQLTPESLLSNFSADAIRFWAARGKLGVDTPFAMDQLKVGNRLVTKLWNAIRFVKDNAKQDVADSFDSSQLDILSRWVLNQLRIASKKYHKSFVEHDYAHSLEALDNFFWNIFCDNYLEIVKDQVFNPEKYDSATVANYSYTMRIVSFEIIKMYAPFVPFVTESLFGALFSAQHSHKSIHQTQFDPESFEHFKFKSQAASFEVVLKALDAVRKIKSENSLSLKTECEKLQLSLKDEDKAVFQDLTATNLLLGATKSKNLILSSDDSVKNILEETEVGFVVHVNLIK